MQQKSCCYQYKIAYYNYKAVYISLMIITKKDTTVHKQEKTGSKAYHYVKSPNHRGKQQKRKRETN